MRAVSALVVLSLTACHTYARETTTRPARDGELIVDPATARPRPATIEVTVAGQLRFVTPLTCTGRRVRVVEEYETVTVRPNLATFVVGVVVGAASAVVLVGGLAADEAPVAGAGGLGLAAAAPLVIGPWIGNGVDERGPRTGELVERRGDLPCGERPVTARAASLRTGRVQVFGAVDADGVFSVSPFTFVDVFAVGEARALDVTADLIDDAGVTTIAAVVEPVALAAARDGYVAAAGLDARVERLRKVPRLDAGAISVERAAIDGRPHLRVAMPLRNDGPGDAWQVRAIVAAAHPELDGRIAYVGALPRGHATDVTLAIPLSAAADAELAGARVELSITLRDAHDTAPATPIAFRGRVP